MKEKIISWLKKPFKEKWLGIKDFLFHAPLKKRLILLLVLVGLGVLVWQIRTNLSSTEEITYKTQTVAKGTLITSISGSGTITSGNSTNITTKASGVVSEVYVTNGDTVTEGQKIAEVTLDDYAQERQLEAWAEYLDAQEAVKTAQKNKVSADISMWEGQQAVLDAIDEVDYKDNHVNNPNTEEAWTESEKAIIDKRLEEAYLAFDEAELKYKNADSEIQLAQAKVSSAWADYQENSSTIYAPSDGTVSDLSLATDMVLNASSSTSSSTGATIVSSQTVGKVSDTTGQLIATISLTEIDIVSVKANQEAILTLDAYEDQTFTGKVLSVDTSGSTTSSVTYYSVTILLDATEVDIYPNMAVDAQIITNMVSDVILIPSTAITTVADQSTVQVLKDGQASSVTVELGDSNDTQTVIVSGLEEGDEVITSTVLSSSASDELYSNDSSPFSGLSDDEDEEDSGSRGGFDSGSIMMNGGGGGMPMGGGPGGF